MRVPLSVKPPTYVCWEEGAMLAKVWTCAVVGLEGELVQLTNRTPS
jgi:hypothetical protein